MLEHFDDWDRELQLYYDATSYNPATGQAGYILRRSLLTLCFQSTSMQGVVSTKQHQRLCCCL